MRNVHAGQAIWPSSGDGDCVGAGACGGGGEDGPSDDGVPALPIGVADAAGAAGVPDRLGTGLMLLLIAYPTPQSAHFAPGGTGVPGGKGLAKPHTPHVQVPPSVGEVGGGAGVVEGGNEVGDDVGAEEDGTAVEEDEVRGGGGGGPRTTMTLGLERMKPA